MHMRTMYNYFDNRKRSNFTIFLAKQYSYLSTILDSYYKTDLSRFQEVKVLF